MVATIRKALSLAGVVALSVFQGSEAKVRGNRSKATIESATLLYNSQHQDRVLFEEYGDDFPYTVTKGKQVKRGKSKNGKVGKDKKFKRSKGVNIGPDSRDGISSDVDSSAMPSTVIVSNSDNPSLPPAKVSVSDNPSSPPTKVSISDNPSSPPTKVSVSDYPSASPSVRPSASPSVRPSASSSVRPSAVFGNEDPSVAFLPDIVVTPVEQQQKDSMCPSTRYIPWKNLVEETDTKFAEVANHLMKYTMELWDKFQSPLEQLPWKYLYDDIRAGAKTMGYDEESWDCCMNHYAGYDFEELQNVTERPHLQLAYQVLGWTEDLWYSDKAAPDTDDSYWEELIYFQQEAAKYLCYEEHSWNQDLNPQSSDREFLNPNTDGVPTVASMNFTCPGVLYTEWVDLTDPEKFAAVDLGYTEFSWNDVNLAPNSNVEALAFEEIMAENDWRQAMADLGYTEDDEWDCCVNHYESYDYVELFNDGEDDDFPSLALAFNVLGWTADNWNTDDAQAWPASESMSWNQLTPFEQAAADYLCYYEESWNGVDGDGDSTIGEREEEET